MIDLTHEAYAKGYYDGRAFGTEVNPYDHADTLRYFYTCGYDAGVADYCNIELAEGVEYLTDYCDEAAT